MKILRLIPFACAWFCQAATGDLLTASVEPNGWQVLLKFASLGTNGTFAFNWSTNNTAASPAVRLTLTSAGYDDNGATTTVQRVIYGTKEIRFQYPWQAYADTQPSGSDVVVRVGLSDYVYSTDVSLTLDIAANLYSTSTAASAFAASNNSTNTVPRVIGNWSQVYGDRVTGNTAWLRCVLAHGHAQRGRPVRAVKFWIADESGDAVTNTVQAPSVDRSQGDQVPVVEYLAPMDISGLTQGDVLTANFVAYPWIGDAAATLNTADGVFSQPTGFYAPLALLNDRTGAYGVTVAVVDAGSGNDSTGAAVDVASFNPSSPPAACATILGAANKIAAYNNSNRSRNDVGGGMIYLRAGNHAFTGSGTAAFGSTPETYVTIASFPGDAQAVINAQAGQRDITDYVKVQNVKIDSDSTYPWQNVARLWWDQCLVDCQTGATLYGTAVWYVTRSTLTALQQGFAPYSGSATHAMLFRGNTLNGYGHIMCGYVTVGNKSVVHGTGRWQGRPFHLVTTPGRIDNCIWACNEFRSATPAADGIWEASKSTNQTIHGVAMFNCLWEQSTNVSQFLVRFAGDGIGLSNQVNQLLWTTTTTGNRINYWYNDANNPVITHCRSVNVLADDTNIKADVFSSDGTDTNNWSQVFGVGWSGNWQSGVVGTSGFTNEFFGLSSHHKASGGTTNDMQYIDRRSYDGSNGGVGGGNYRLKVTSPAIGLASEKVIEFDLDGNRRRYNGAIGAYEYAIQRKRVRR